jgi:hypothetical protein
MTRKLTKKQRDSIATLAIAYGAYCSDKTDMSQLVWGRMVLEAQIDLGMELSSSLTAAISDVIMIIGARNSAQHGSAMSRLVGAEKSDGVPLATIGHPTGNMPVPDGIDDASLVHGEHDNETRAIKWNEDSQS